jgi:hypothetical protein
MGKGFERRLILLEKCKEIVKFPLEFIKTSVIITITVEAAVISELLGHKW